MKAIQLLEQAGFKMESFDGSRKILFGTIAPEPYDVGKNHFEPRIRTVFVSSQMKVQGREPFFYVTSNIVGRWRGYRCKTWNENAEVGNIFGSGPTREEAIRRFIVNFKAKTYNRSSHM